MLKKREELLPLERRRRRTAARLRWPAGSDDADESFSGLPGILVSFFFLIFYDDTIVWKQCFCNVFASKFLFLSWCCVGFFFNDDVKSEIFDLLLPLSFTYLNACLCDELLVLRMFMLALWWIRSEGAWICLILTFSSLDVVDFQWWLFLRVVIVSEFSSQWWYYLRVLFAADFWCLDLLQFVSLKAGWMFVWFLTGFLIWRLASVCKLVCFWEAFDAGCLEAGLCFDRLGP